MRLELTAAALLALGVGGCYVVAGPDGVGVGVGVSVRPVYAPIASTGIQVVTNASGDVFFYGGTYYRWFNGRWWRSPTWRSGWAPITVVPRVFLNIPSWHPRYHVVRHHPLRPTTVVRPAHPVHPTHPVHPARPTPKVKVPRPAPGAVKVEHGRPTPPRPPKVKKEKDEKGKGRK
jgi:hypothetical protein